VRNDAYNDVAFRLKIWTHDTEYGDFDQWTYVSSQNYQTYSQKWDKNPYTTDTWTADEVNALKAGIQNTYYSGTSTQIRVTQFSVVVNEVPSTVIPEYALGGLLALIACFAAFFIIKRPKLNLRSN
jgi:hypothetical protein